MVDRGNPALIREAAIAYRLAAMHKACPTNVARFVAALGFAAAPLVAMDAKASEPPTTIVVLDGSGSMWGKPAGERQTKLVLARDAIRKGLTRSAPQSRVGVMSFGHRRGGDCQDTEIILEPAARGVDATMEPLERLSPRGRGPIFKALREAAELLGNPSAPAGVVLIHDGPDNCQQDPCAAIGALRAAHPQVRVHVVSLDMSAEDANSVSCLARSTGGKHFVVSSAADIDNAVSEALGASSASVPAPVAPGAPRGPATPLAIAPPAPGTAAGPRAGVPAGRPGLQIWTSLVKDSPALSLPVDWTVRRAGSRDTPLWQGTTAVPLLLLPTGRYDIEARIGLVTRTATADAVEGAPRLLGIPLDAGLLALTKAAGAKDKLDDTTVTITRLEAKGPGDTHVLRGARTDLPVPPGNYLVSITSGALRIDRPVGVAAGEKVSIAGSLGLGTLELSTVNAKGGTTVDGLLYVVSEDDPDAPLGRREVASSAASTPSFQLPAGGYYVVVRRGSAETSERVIVRNGEVEKRRIVLDSAQISLSVRLQGGRAEEEGQISHRIVRLDVQPPETTNASGPIANLELAAGQYRLETRIGRGNVRTKRELRLEPGRIERIAIAPAAGAARLRLIDRASGRPIPDVAFEVLDRTGQTVWSGLGTEPRVLLLAGRYTVRAEGRGVTAEHPFEISPGDDAPIDIAAR
jgi:Ca-activated chloride channel family protein